MSDPHALPSPEVRALLRTPPPTRDEEVALFQKLMAGDPEAEREIVRRNVRLVAELAGRYRRSGLPFDDLFQEGLIGLVRAVRKFEPRRGLRFSTYAYQWIRQALNRSAMAATRVIRLPEAVRLRVARVLRTQKEMGLDPSNPDARRALADRLDLPPEEVDRLRNLAFDVASLEALLDDREDRAPLNERDGVREGPVPAPEEQVLRERDLRALGRAVQVLPDREAHIVLHRFGLADGPPRSRAWLGRSMGISAERVRQLERRALSRLRGELEVAGAA